MKNNKLKRFLVNIKIILIVIGLLCISLQFVGCSDSNKVQNEQNNGIDEKQKVVAEQLEKKNKELTEEDIKFYDDQGTQFELKVPKTSNFAVDTVFELKGTITLDEEIKNMIVIVKKDGKQHMQYFPLEANRFDGQVKLPFGEGSYEISVTIPTNTSYRRYRSLAEIKVYNINKEIVPAPVYYPRYASENVKFIAEPNPKENGKFSFKGTLGRPDVNALMVLVECDNQKSYRYIPVIDGKFECGGYLFKPKQLHKITFALPASFSENVIAEYEVLNTSSDELPMNQEFLLAGQKGFFIEDKMYSFPRFKDKFVLKGYFDENKFSQSDNDLPLIVQTKKDGLEASYSIPIKDNSFAGDVWLCFGEGEYEVNVGMIKGLYNDRIEYLAKFFVDNKGQADLRDLAPSSRIESEYTQIIELATEITKGKTTEREKARAVYEWVCKNISYDWSKYTFKRFSVNDGAIKTLNTKKGVCQDYAFLTVALLRASGMEARVVSGDSVRDNKTESHAWTEVKVDGQWLVMDSTWGAGGVTAYGKFVPKYKQQWFDPDPEEFAKTHKRDKFVY